MDFWRDVFVDPPSLTIYGFLVRSLITYLFLVLMTRISGAVEIGEMTAIDFIAAITIGSIASASLVESEVHLGASLLSIALWTFFTIGLNIIGFRLPGLRRVLVGRPIMLIKDGKILESNLRKAKMNFDDLISALRAKGAPLVEDVEFAILEPGGEVSVVKKAAKQPVTPDDLKLQAVYQGVPTVLVLKGRVAYDNLAKLGQSEEWLRHKLQEAGVDRVSDVFAAQLDSQGNLYIDLYDDAPQRHEQLEHRTLLNNLAQTAARLRQYAGEAGVEQLSRQYAACATELEKMHAALNDVLLPADNPPGAAGEDGPPEK